jgi:2,4-diaminopentanoate dehydrogenase
VPGADVAPGDRLWLVTSVHPEVKRGPLRVAVCGSGWIGSIAVRSLSARPGVDLTGLWVHSADKVGRDAGEICGGPPVGVIATGDLGEIIAGSPDCVVYAASGPELDAAALADYERLLGAGINVVTVTSPGLVYPPAYEDAGRRRLEAAAEKGGATLYASGMEPGFAADQLVLTLLTMSDTIRSVRAQEIFLYDVYPVAFMMREVFGFGQPLDHRPIMAMPGVQSMTWAPPIRLIADAMGVQLDEVRETYDRVLTDRVLEVASGTIEAGTVGAVRFETIGVVAGRDAIVIEHVNRMAADLAPQWPTAERDGTYRIVVDGSPSLECELTLGRGDQNASDEGMVGTAMRIVNAVPLVCAAAPGLVSSLELGLTLPHHAFREPT